MAGSLLSTLSDPLGYLPLILIFSAGLYTIYGVVYRLWLCPIAKFPGPRFAALTFWNEFYYDVWLGGKYTWKLLEYHEQHGPVIRINPYELHIYDPEFYEDLYVGASKRKTDKWDWAMRMFGQYDNSAFDTLAHDKHRMRREPWNPYFSKASVSRLQPLLIQSCVDKLCARLAEHSAAGKPVIMTHAYACLTADVISEYAFPSGYNLLDAPEFDRDHYDAWMALSKMSHTLKQFGWLYPVLESLPLWFTKMTSPETYLFLRLSEELLEQTLALAACRESTGYKEMTGRPSMLESFLASNLPPQEKNPSRIRGEAISAMGAGTLTSSHCLKHATYHVLANPPILNRLMHDLETAIPNPNCPPILRELEQIHYLVAIMYESLRMFYGVSHRLQRVFPNDPVRYKEWVIPAGTPVSMTSVHIHEDEKVFPEPKVFKPERWLPLQTEGQRLMKYLAAFGKGSRQCVGMELGKAEILTALACVFRRFGRRMRLVDSVRERDIDCVYDVFNPLSSREGNGLVVIFEQIA